MSAYNHNLCDKCWTRRNGSREPIRLREAPKEICCNCGELTGSGIVVRADPCDYPCLGDHSDLFRDGPVIAPKDPTP